MVILFIVLVSCMDNACFGFDVGGYITPPKEKQLNLEVVSQEYNRKIEVSGSQQNAILKENGIYPLVAETRIHILSLRSSLYFRQGLSLSFEYGLYNDLETTFREPSFMGGLAKISLLRKSPLKIVPYVKYYQTKTYQYEIFEKRLPYLYSAIFESRINYFAYGLFFGTEINFKGNNKFFPYVGVEHSTMTSEMMDSIKMETKERGGGVFYIEDDFRVNSTDPYAIVLGLTLLRRGYSTIRSEYHYWRRGKSISLNVGFLM